MTFFEVMKHLKCVLIVQATEEVVGQPALWNLEKTKVCLEFLHGILLLLLLIIIINIFQMISKMINKGTRAAGEGRVRRAAGGSGPAAG